MPKKASKQMKPPKSAPDYKKQLEFDVARDIQPKKPKPNDIFEMDNKNKSTSKKKQDKKPVKKKKSSYKKKGY
jgi:hypothetical protein